MLTVVCRARQADKNSGDVGRSRLDEIAGTAVNALDLMAPLCAGVIVATAKLLGCSTEERAT